MTFGKFIKEERVKQNMTLDELSEKSKLSKGFISKVENDKQDISRIGNVKKLSDGLGVKRIELIIRLGMVTKQDIYNYNKGIH